MTLGKPPADLGRDDGGLAAGRPTFDRPTFVGRQRELDELAGALDEALAGRGSAFLLVGEPGIGKTRLCDELVHRAGLGQVTCLWGRAWQAGGAPAYWPWIAVLEGLLTRVDDVALREGLGPGAAALAAIVPEFGARLGPAPPLPPSAEEARFRLWRAVAALVRRAAEPQGLVLAFEDLHAADESSLALLHFVACGLRGSRVMLLSTCRDTEAHYEPSVAELIARIARESTTLPIGRLGGQAALQLLQSRGPDLDGPLAQRILSRAQGNPLFIQEIARLVERQDPSALDAEAIPASVRELIRQRLDHTSEKTRALLDLAAVAGDEIDVALLASAANVPPSAVSAGLDEAVRAGIVQGRAPRARFAHALLREALYQALPAGERQARHAAVAAALAARPAEGAKPPSAKLAHHLLDGGDALLPQAIEAAIAAAAQALGQLGHDEAIALLERAAAALAGAGNPPKLRGKLASARGAAHIQRGDFERGKAFCREAARLARDLGDRALLAQAALSYGRVYTFGVVDPVLIDLLDEALAAHPSPGDPTRVALQARLAAGLQPTAKTEEPVRVAREAIAGARQLGDRRLLLDTLSAAIAAMMDVAPPRERLALNLESEELAMALDDQPMLLRAHGRLVIDHMALGQWSEADARIAAYENMARAQHAAWVAWRAPLFRSMRAMAEGRFGEAEAFIGEGERAGSGISDPQVARCLALHKESFLRAAERHDEWLALDVGNRRHRADFFSGHYWQASASALLSSRREDADKTRFYLSLIPPDAMPPIDNLYALFLVAEPLAAVGQPELVEKIHAMVAATADDDVMLGMTQLSWEGPKTRVLALLEARLGRFDVAAQHFEAALLRVQALGARPLAARTRYEYGRACLAVGRTAQGYDLLTQARADALALGQPGLIRLCDDRLATLPKPAPAPAAAPAPPIAVSAAAMTQGLPFSLVKEGEVWAFGHAGTTFRLKDSLGLRYLAKLCGEPEREFHVLDLVGGDAGGEPAAADGGDAGELLDEEARANYRRRIAELRDELQEAERFADPGRQSRARTELEFLTTEISRATGLGGRVRRAGAAAERARSAVQRRIKNALARIEAESPGLAAYLGRCIRTGNHCVFRPGPDSH